MSDKILSIVVPIFNQIHFTLSCLKDLSKLPNDHEIIVVDDCSTDATQSKLENSTEIKYVRQHVNGGFSKSVNRGCQEATAPNVLFLNNDIRVKSDFDTWTQPLIKRCPYAIVGPTMGQLDNNFSFVQEADRVLTGKSYMSGWCLASSKEIFKKLEVAREPDDQSDVPQLFLEKFGKAYFEDADLSFRARRLNIAMEVVSVPVVHFGKQSTKQLNIHALYQNARNIFIKQWKV